VIDAMTHSGPRRARRFGATAVVAMALSAGCSSSATITMNGPCDGAAGDACVAPDAVAVDVLDATDRASPMDAFASDGAGDIGTTSDVRDVVDASESCVRSCGARVCGDDGCGGVCGRCSTGTACTAAGACEPDPTTRWTVEAVDGMVLERKSDGSNWDPFGGLPDPFVCVTIASDRECSASVSDTLSPVWNFRHPMTATTSELQAGVRFEVSDSDPTSANDVIGDVMAMAPDNAFVDPVWNVIVGRANVRVRLTVAP
jgi:hypothetical protein